MIYDSKKRLIIENDIISSLLNDPELYFSMEIKIEPVNFSNIDNKLIFEAIQNVATKDGSLSLSTINNYLSEDTQIDFAFLMEKTQNNPSLLKSAFNNLCTILLEYDVCDKISDLFNEYLDQSKHDIDDFKQYVNQLKSKVNGIEVAQVSNEILISNAVDETINLLVERKKNFKEEKLQGIPTGLDPLDDFTSGWVAPDLIIQAGRPGMGKTAAVINNIGEILKQNIPAALFSYEMQNSQILFRLLSKDLKINSKKFLKGQLTDSEEKLAKQYLRRYTDLPLYLHDKPYPLSTLINKIRYLYYKYNVKIVFIDYLQLITNDIDKSTNDSVLIGGISTRLKQLCLELKIPIVLLSQLSRNVEERRDKRPKLSDLRGSGSLEQDADVVLFYYRPEYYDKTMKDYFKNGENLCQIIVAKGRALGTIEIDAYYKKEFNYFSSWTNDVSQEVFTGNKRHGKQETLELGEKTEGIAW